MRYLTDTNVLVAALLSKRGASYQVVRLALTGDLPIVMQHKLLWEYRDVTERPHLASQFALNQTEVGQLIARLAFVAHEIPVKEYRKNWARLTRIRRAYTENQSLSRT